MWRIFLKIRSLLRRKFPIIHQLYLHLRALYAYTLEFFLRSTCFLPCMDKYAYAVARAYTRVYLSGHAERVLSRFIHTPTIETDFLHFSCLCDQGRVEDAWNLYNVMVERYGESSILEYDSFSIYCCVIFLGDALQSFSFQRKIIPSIGCGVNYSEYRGSVDRDRDIKVGYISFHCIDNDQIRNFVGPLLGHTCDKRMKLYGYFHNDDVLSKNYKKNFVLWHDISELNDMEISRKIYEDEIDILVSISLGGERSAISVFNYKPSPLSCSWWVSSGSGIGLNSVDYSIVDNVIAPSGAEKFFAEKELWRLGEASVAFAGKGTYPTSPLPAQKNGYVTFNYVSNLQRINDRTIAVWSSILKRVSQSKLIINTVHARDKLTQKIIISKFEKYGVSPNQIIIYYRPMSESVVSSDITLSPFPVSSGTSVPEVMLSGHPVVAMMEEGILGRLAAAHLTYAGCEQWIAHSDEEYIDVAVNLASDIEALAEIRRTLPEIVTSSMLMDTQGLSSRLASAYREMWQRWCDKQNSTKSNNISY